MDTYQSGLGLPAKDEMGSNLTRAPYPHDYQVGPYGYLDHDHDSGLLVFIPRPGVELPPVLRDYKVLSLAEGIINAASKNAPHPKRRDPGHIYCCTGLGNGYNLLKEVNEELARQNTGIVVWKLTWENEDCAPGLFAGLAPRLRNAHALTTLTGYAIDPDDHTLGLFWLYRLQNQH